MYVIRDMCAQFEVKFNSQSFAKLINGWGPPDFHYERRVLPYTPAAELVDLKVPPGNKLEALKGDRAGFHSIRINDQWRLVFKWNNGNAEDVTVEDYH